MAERLEANLRVVAATNSTVASRNDGVAADRDGKRRLADPGRPEEQHCVAIGEEPSGGKIPDLAPVNAELRGDVEPGEVAIEREAKTHLDPTLILGRPLKNSRLDV